MKLVVTNAPVLKYFDSTVSLTLQCDASVKGLGAVLLQKGEPISYASRALTESVYAQIEKELLAFVYGLERFHTYNYDREADCGIRPQASEEASAHAHASSVYESALAI